MFMAHSFQMLEIGSAVTNSAISHSAFRLYVLLSMAADRSVSQAGFTSVSYEGIEAMLPGVRGKPPTVWTIRNGLRELRSAGLIETATPSDPSARVLVRLTKPDEAGSRKVGDRIRYEKDSS